MKPFGVRLAAGAVTILLAAIMAGQAQKNRQNESNSSWKMASSEIGEPPKPIGMMSSESWMDGPPSTERTSKDPSEDSSFPAPGAAVKLVQHTEPVGEPAPETLKVESPGFDMSEMTLPTFSEPEDAAAVPAASGAATRDAGGAMELPTTPDTFAADAPKSIMSLPTETPAAAADSAQAETMPTTPAITIGGPSVLTTPSDGTAATTDRFPQQGAFPQQSGNALRGGAGNELRPNQSQAAITMPTRPAQAPKAPFGQENSFGHDNTFAAGPDPMRRTLETPQQPNPAVTGQAADPNRQQMGADGLGNQQARQPNPADANINSVIDPNMRILGAPASNETVGAPPFQTGGLRMGQVQPANTFNGQSYNQPTSNYAPNLPTHAGNGQPIAPPLQNNGPAARVASLPGGGNFAPGYPSRPFDQPNAAAQINVDPSATMAAPGDRRFEGIQSPSIVIHKRAPSEVKVGKPASFVIHVQNTGSVEAMDVRVHDRVPAGMQLVDASPTPVQQGNVLMWQLGSMRAGDERTVSMQLIPMEEGELGSVARVTFEAAASVRTISTRPELKIVQTAREQVLVGQQLEIDLEISNPGTGEATGVVLQEDVPDGLEHPKGRQLDNVIGTLRPGETRRQVLRLRAVTPGVVQNTIHLRGDDGLESTHTVNVEIIAPQLQLKLSGPSKRFLERKATYQLDIANAGTADATNVEIAAYLDRGFTFVSTEFEGQYDPSRHAVFWSLASLPAGGTGGVPLTLLPVQEGERAIRMEARADLGVVAKSERTVTVDSLAELTFQITDSADPVEIGGETMYEIKLTNSGSRVDSNVRVQLQLPQGVELLSSDADAETDGRGMIAFAPHRELAAGGEMVYRVKARGVAPGTHLIKAVVISDQSTVPVTKEESTMIYSDR